MRSVYETGCVLFGEEEMTFERINRKIVLLATIVAILSLPIFLPVRTLAGEYFHCDEMDHFSPEGACANKPKAAPESGRNPQGSNEEAAGFTKEQIEMWGEPSVDSSGKVVTKIPPSTVMRFLTDPSQENAQAYMEWNKKRSDALQRSQAILQGVTGVVPDQGISNINDIKKVDFYFSPT